MKIRRSYNPDEVKRVFLNPEIFATIAEEGQRPEDFEPDFSTEIYLAVEAEDTVIGFYALKVLSHAEMDIHAQILPEYRKHYSIESGFKVLEWFYKEAPERFQKLTAQVPFVYPNVKDFCLKCGMKIEGINGLSYYKDGELHDQWYFGITRQEIGKHYGLD